MTTDIDDAIAALHQGQLDSFLEGRKALAARLKKAGDKEGAARVAALAKPTPSAWACNRVSATARAAFVSLMQNGVALREAMRLALRGFAGQDVVALQRRQREAIEGLIGEALRLLTEAGLPASDVVIGRVRTNLTTIGTSGSWGDSTSACLTKDLQPIDIAALAALLDASPPDDRSSPPIPSEGGKPRAPLVDEAALLEAAKRVREEKLRVLRTELEAAEEVHASREAAVAERAAAVEIAEATGAETLHRSKAALAEVARLELLASEARDVAAEAGREADTASARLADAKREREGAAQEAIRSGTHAIVVRQQLEQAEQEH